MPQLKPKAGVVAPRRLYLTLDGDIVEGQDPRRHSLLAAEGAIISQADVERYGVTVYLSEPAETETTILGTEEPAVSDDTKALEKLTVAQLKELAAESGVTLVGDEKKADLVTALASAGVKAPEKVE